MNNNGITGKLVAGVFCGVITCALHALLSHFAAAYAITGFTTVGVVVAALFFGMRSGIAAGTIAVAYGAFVAWPEPALVDVLSPFFAAAAAVAIRRYALFGQRPGAVHAAFYAMLISFVYLSVVLVCGINGDSQHGTLVTIYKVALPLTLLCMAVAAVFSFVLRVPITKRSALRPFYAIAAFAGLVAGVWMAESRASMATASAEMDVLGETLVTEIDYLVEPPAFRMAQAIVDEAGTLEKAVSMGAAYWTKRMHVSRVSFVNKKGIIVASSDAKSIGEDFHTNEAAKELLSGIIDGEDRYSQLRFRPAFVDDGSNTRFKYVAIAFPEGGCVIVGDELSEYATRFDYIYELAMVDWKVGNKGTYVLVNPKTKTVLSAVTEDWIGKPLSETGLDKLALEPNGDEVRASAMGIDDALIKRVDIDFADMDAYMVIPVAEIMNTRDLSVAVFAMALTVIFIFGSMLLSKIARQQEHIQSFYAAEEERRAKDMKHAADIQNSALPVNFNLFTSTGKVDLFARMRTAKEVGGDFFDFFALGDNRIFLVIADVSGKGVPAALFMMRTMATIRSEAHSGAPLAEILSAANDKLCVDNLSDMFVTVWGGIYDMTTGELEYVSVGHNPPYIRHADGTVEQVKSPRALVMAAMPQRHYVSNKVQLKSGDRLFLYTDGVTEAVAENLELMGEGRLEDALKDCGGAAVDTCQKVLARIDQFAGTMPQADDITVLTLVRT